MKKHLFFAATAALVLASCSSDSVDFTQADVLQAQDDNSVQFSTYMGKTGTTRAGAKGDIVAPNAATGNKLGTNNYEFGVFAYYTGGNTYGQQQRETYTAETGTATKIAPNFMYNQKVASADEGATWTYSPIKYWPNDFASGAVDKQTNAAQGSATNGNVSFFAYAPYVAYSGSMGSYGITNMTTNSTTGDPILTYTLDQDNFVDLLWGTLSGTSSDVLGTAQAGVTGNSSATDNTYIKAILDGKTVNADLKKQEVDGKVGFNFLHALSKVGGKGNGSTTGFLVQLDIDNGTNVSGGTRETFNYAGSGAANAYRTIVTVESVEITNDVDNNGSISGDEVGNNGVQTLNLATGQWTQTTAGTNKFTQTIKDNNGSGELQLNTKIAEHNKAQSKTWFEHLTSSNVYDYFAYTNAEGVSNDHPGVMENVAQSVYQDEQFPLVFFPGTTPKFKITVKYIVRTYDDALSTKCTEVTQTISKVVAFANPVEMNKHYSILMHLGLTGVKFTASVSDWDTDIDNDHDTDLDDAEDVHVPLNVE